MTELPRGSDGAAGRAPLVTLLTDFGVVDPFVGVMKGVIATLCPGVAVVDMTHEVAPQDVQTAALLLERSFRYFPRGTVHLAVVDPGVGTDRKPIAVASEGHLFVGPDNGLLSLAAARGSAVTLDRPEFFLPNVSRTFHGRDVFAPVAAHLARGVPLSRVGSPLRQRVRLRWPAPRLSNGALRGKVVLVDRFGNLITNLEPAHLSHVPRPVIAVGDAVIDGVSATYGQVAPGELAAVVGGYGLLEIAVRNGSAEGRLGLGRGATVLVKPAARRRPPAMPRSR